MQECPRCGEPNADQAARCACGFGLASAPDPAPDERSVSPRWAGRLGLVSGLYWGAFLYVLEEGDVRHDFLPVLVLLASPVVLLGTVVGALLSIVALWRWISGRMAPTEPTVELLGGAHADLVVGLVGNVIVPLVLAVLFARGAYGR